MIDESGPTPSTPTAPGRLEEPLLEREPELAALTELLRRATSGTGALAVLEGPPGIGKSRLVEATTLLAKELGLTALRARASEFEQDLPYGVVRQLFEPLLADERAPAETLLAGAARLAEPVFTDRVAEQAPESEASFAVLHGLHWLTVNAATRAPLALLVDDGHWADRASLRFLAYLVNRMPELPLFLIVALRPPEPGAQMALIEEVVSAPLATRLAPAALSERAAAELLESVLGESPDPTFVANCWAVTQGNPFFLRELATTLAAEGVRPLETKAAVVPEIAPQTVARSVMRRVERLPAEALQLARALAVLGDAATSPRAVALSGLRPDELATAMELLGQAQLVDPVTLQFVHPIVRAAIRSGLPAGARPHLHAAAAQILADDGADEALVALHLVATAPSGDSGRVEQLRAAAARARAQGAPETAARYLRRALEEPPGDDLRAEVLLELGLAETAAFGTEGFDALRAAIAAAPNPATRARVTLEYEQALSSHGAFDEGAHLLEQAYEELARSSPELRLRVEARMLAAAIQDAAVYERMSPRIVALVDRAETIDDPLLLAPIAFASAMQREPASAAGDLAERALASGRVSVSEEPLLFLELVSAVAGADRIGVAADVCEAAVEEARSQGSLLTFAFASALRAYAAMRRGAVASAEADVRFRLDLLEDRAVVSRVVGLAPLIDALHERGALTEASELLDTHGVGEDLPDLLVMSTLLESAARLRLTQGRPEEAVRLLESCQRRLQAWDCRNPTIVGWRATLALARSALGQEEAAHRLIEEDLALARSFEVPRALGISLRVAGLLAGSKGGIDLLREAVTTLAATEARLEHARALMDLGGALRRGGYRKDARDPLREALELAQRGGAGLIAETAHQELVAAGARPRRRAFSGLEALTASERRVAEMAAKSMSNREIAQALFVSEKTVEGHLGKAYRKLDIKSRSELPRALGRDVASSD